MGYNDVIEEYFYDYYRNHKENISFKGYLENTLIEYNEELNNYKKNKNKYYKEEQIIGIKRIKRDIKIIKSFIKIQTF